MDNRAPDYKLSLPDGGHLLRDALNVDVTAQGTVKTRAGYALAQAGNDCHSLWSPVEGDYALYVDDGDLYRIDTAKTLIASGFGSATPVRYTQVYEAVYFTDGLRVGSYHPSSGPTPEWASATATTIGDQVLVPMPAGQHIAHRAGRTLEDYAQIPCGFGPEPVGPLHRGAVEFLQAGEAPALHGVGELAARDVLRAGSPHRVRGIAES